MHYVLIENGTLVHLGPIEWRPRMFLSYIEDDLELEGVTLPATAPAAPIQISETFAIHVARTVEPAQHNAKIKQLAGPTWAIVEGVAIGTYTSVDKPIEQVKGELKGVVANNRWAQEVAGFSMELQGQTVRITTQRGDRDIFLQTYQLMAEEDTKQWKFGATWLTLTKAEILAIVTSVVSHVQASFTWEQTTVAAIEGAVSLEALDALNLTYA
jgi:hypothetical protein